MEGVKAVQIPAAARLCQTESTGLGLHLFWPGLHIRMNAYIQVNENPVRKLQPWFSRITARNLAGSWELGSVLARLGGL